MNYHMKTCGQNKKYYCYQCMKKFPSRVMFKKHMYVEHANL